jgi:hypothetical protein
MRIVHYKEMLLTRLRTKLERDKNNSWQRWSLKVRLLEKLLSLFGHAQEKTHQNDTRKCAVDADVDICCVPGIRSSIEGRWIMLLDDLYPDRVKDKFKVDDIVVRKKDSLEGVVKKVFDDGCILVECDDCQDICLSSDWYLYKRYS